MLNRSLSARSGATRGPGREPVDVLAEPLPELVVLGLGPSALWARADLVLLMCLAHPARREFEVIAHHLDLLALLAFQRELFPATLAVRLPSDRPRRSVRDSSLETTTHKVADVQPAAANSSMACPSGDARCRGLVEFGLDVDRKYLAGGRDRLRHPGSARSR